MKTFENWLQGKMLGSMEKEFARDAWNAAVEAMRAESEPFGYYENRRFSVSIDGGPDKYRERKAYQGPLYTKAQPLRELSLDETLDIANKVFLESNKVTVNQCVRFAKLVREAK